MILGWFEGPRLEIMKWLRTDKQTDRQTEFQLVDSTPPVGGVEWKETWGEKCDKYFWNIHLWGRKIEKKWEKYDWNIYLLVRNTRQNNIHLWGEKKKYEAKKGRNEIFREKYGNKCEKYFRNIHLWGHKMEKYGKKMGETWLKYSPLGSEIWGKKYDSNTHLWGQKKIWLKYSPLGSSALSSPQPWAPACKLPPPTEEGV